MTQTGKPNLIITGSSGLIGQRLVNKFAEEFRVLGLDVVEPQSKPTTYDWVKCDLTDDGSVSSAFARIKDQYGDRVASVIHLAAYYDFSGEPSPLYQELTVEGTQRLLRALHQLRVEQLVFSSSLLVMQPVDDGEPLDEQSPTEAEWAYPESKLEAEDVLREERGDIPVVAHRIAGVYDEDCHSLPIGQQIRRIREKKLESFLFPGDKEHGQPFIHLDDAAECFHATVARRHDLDPFEVFLIAEPDVVSQDELQETLGELIHGKAWPTVRIPKAAAKAGAWLKEKVLGQDTFIKPWMVDLADDNYPVAIDKARDKLGWRPRHRLRDTLAEIIARLQRDPRGWYELNNLPLPDDLAEESEQDSERKRARA